MEFSYYPGCTLKNKAVELDRCARECAAALGVTLTEIPQWQCCGGVFPMATDEYASKLASVRALAGAQSGRLVTVCSACHHVLKRVNYEMAHSEAMAERVNNYMAPDMSYHGETQVLHYLEMLRDVVGFDNLKKQVKNPLKGRRIGAYYGCLLLRPSKEMEFDDPENPSILEEFIRALGAEPVLYAQRNECCSGYVALESQEVAQKRRAAILDSASGQGAQELITACPLCMYNLNKAGQALPVHYFTELLAEALGVK